MNVLSAQGIGKVFSDKWLYKDLNLGLSEGDKLALIGVNGAGKTTLLKTLAAQLQPDAGEVVLRRGIRAVYLEQAPRLDEAATVAQILFEQDNPVAKASVAYERAMAHPELTSEEEMERVLILMDELQAWDYEQRIQVVLGKLSITDLDQTVGSLSGGQRKRVALAAMVLSEPDLILLDEPTNHLDLEAIEWLENYLRSAQTTLLMVSHDRYFLDAACNGILELDRGQLYRYSGNYAYFLEKKADREASLKVQVERARNLYTRELDWMRRQPRARGTKAKYRVEAFDKVKEQAHLDLRRSELQLSVQSSRQGGKVLEVRAASVNLGGKQLVDGFSHVFRKGERVGLIGRNGVGKSTFLNLLTGRLSPDTGEVDWGVTTKVGYYTQESEDLNLEARIIDEVKEIAEFVTLADGKQVSVSKLLEMFLFPVAQQYTPVGKLSGGERRRLQLLKVLVQSPNFLILDEPTNDLDIDTLNVLEAFLEEFGGCLMLVSHDRYFMDRLVEHLFLFEGDGKIRDFGGNYSDYRQWLDDNEANANAKPGITATAAPKAEAPASPPAKPARKLSFKEQKELEDMPKTIERLEAERERLTSELTDAGADYAKIRTLSARIEQINAELEQKMERWVGLEG